MKPINDGGPAFPTGESLNCHGEVFSDQDPKTQGMSLRDYFAVHATEEDIRDHSLKCDAQGILIRPNTRAQARYAFAAEMLKAREEKP